VARKFAILTTLIIVALVSLLERIGYQDSVQALEEALERRMTTTGVLVASLASEAIAMNFFSFLEEEMITLKNENPDILYAMVVNSERVILAHSDVEQTMGHYDGAMSEGPQTLWKPHKLTYQVPVKLGDDSQANFLFAVSTDTIDMARKQLIWQSLFKIFGIVAIGVLLSFWLGRKFVSPIVVLSQDAKSIASGNLEEPIETGYQDEVGSLALSFEQMRESLKRRYDEILDLNKTLDAKVVERTEDLRKTLIEVESANQKIMDSIHYATTIQQALLPNLERVRPLCEGFFSIWKPRDEVGGDIYLVEQVQGKMVTVLIDCTGHGVPGALMTMLAMSALQRILSEESDLDPSAILSRLNVLVKTTLNQDRSDAISDDGLEAIVCIYDPNQYHLQMASSRLSAFLVQGNQVQRIKGDRASIGYRRSDPDYEFTLHNIAIEDNLTLYLFSDGFFEQVGSETNRPFGFRRLVNLLKSIQEVPFDEQKDSIWERFTTYRGRREIQDDVTVLGVKLGGSSKQIGQVDD